MVIVKIITGIALMSLGVIFLYFVGKITKKLFWPEAVNDKDFVVLHNYDIIVDFDWVQDETSDTGSSLRAKNRHVFCRED